LERLNRLSDVVIVVPCYNEANRLEREKFLACLDERPRLGFLFVNDGSRDGTLEVLEGLRSARGERVRVLDCPENRGKAEAVRRGVLDALERAPAYVGYWDADLATPLSELPAFIDTIESRPNVELVMGARIKLLGRRVVRRLSRRTRLRHRRVDDPQARRLRRSAVPSSSHLASLREVFGRPLSCWIFDVEIIARMIAVPGSTTPVEGVIYELRCSMEGRGGSRISWTGRRLLRPGADLRRYLA
jgi:glycosyltransferase involved in cell wall biosynthesis